jgi:hypothetical protein
MPVEILSLPSAIRTVPEDPENWFKWRDDALAHRVSFRAKCEKDQGARAFAVSAAAADPVYDFLMFGAIFEPRDRLNPDGTLRPKGWYPWIPYHFQVEMARTIEHVMGILPGSAEALLGRGDLVIEKARGMAGSWTVAGVVANHWKYDDGFVAAFSSYRADEVDKTNSTNTLFFKVEGYLGLDKRVHEFKPMRVGDAELLVPLRSPAWMVPAGYAPAKHNHEFSLSHPEKTNLVAGYATTSEMFTSTRFTVVAMDELAKFYEAQDAWDGAHAVTDHRIGLSSAWLKNGPAFMRLAKSAREANDKGTAGPTYIRLKADVHPERDEVWREEAEARQSGSAAAKAALAREYDLDYEAGQGQVYMYRELAQQCPVKPLSFSPSTEKLDFCIDPGARAQTAFHLVKYNPDKHRYGLLASYANSMKTAEFYASLVTASPLYTKYTYGPDEERIMEWFAEWGPSIRFWIGDPAGKQVNGVTATSFYTEIYKETAKLTNAPDGRGIAIYSSDKPDFKSIDARREALNWLLPLLDVNDAPDTRTTLAGIMEHHVKSEPDRETTNVSALPVRHENHDKVTALEFLACYHKKRAGFVPEDAAAEVPQRFSRGGKVLDFPRRSAFGVAA